MCQNRSEHPCSKCKSTCCICRYNGPDYEEIGIEGGQTLDEVIQLISEFISGIEFEDGVGISSIINIGDGTFTIFLTDGSSYNVGNFTGPQGPPGDDGPIGPQGPPGPTEMIIQNTLIVSKNGSDLTGTRNDWTKPFLTVSAASTAAQVGDLVIVFPGTYSENNYIKSDVNYYFNRGVTMVSSTNCINDSSGAMNIYILGEGNFVSTNARGVFLLNENSNIFMRLNRMSGLLDGVTIGNALNVDIEGRTLEVSQQYLSTIRGNCQGRIHFDTWDGSEASLGGVSIFFFNHSLDSVSREFKITGNILNSNSSTLGAVALENCPTLRVTMDLDIKHSAGLDSTDIAAIYVKSGNLKYSGIAESVDNVGIIIGETSSSPCTVLLKDSEIIGKDHSMRVLSSGSNYIRSEETTFRKGQSETSATVQVDAVGTVSQILFRNSDIYNPASGTGANGIYAADNASVIRLSDVRVVLGLEGAFLMDSPVSRTVAIESIVSSNQALSTNVTNSITGSVLVVDTSISDNSFNF